MKPKVSIIIPVYNGSNYLANAIDCALNQTYNNLEIIVVNDGSTDDGKTDQIAKSYGDRIRYFSKSNGGVSSALNYGIQHMTGEYFSWLSHDDEYSENKIADAITLLEKHCQLNQRCIAFTGGFFIDSHGKRIKGFSSRFEAERLYSGIEAVEELTQRGTINGCCMLIPRRAFDEVAFFHEQLRYSQDSLMWYQLFLAGYSLVSDNKENVTYRLHRNQTSQNRRDLYEHDTLAIATILAEPLMKADPSGNILCHYIKRLTKNCCNDAINALMDTAKQNHFFTAKQKVVISIARLSGFVRYQAVRVKRVLIRFVR